jgi:hypothetical protein
MTITPLFRGEPWQDRIVLPVDLERPHRFMESPTLHGVCVCARRKVNDYHGEDAKQRTVSYRSEYAG